MLFGEAKEDPAWESADNAIVEPQRRYAPGRYPVPCEGSWSVWLRL